MQLYSEEKKRLEGNSAPKPLAVPLKSKFSRTFKVLAWNSVEREEKNSDTGGGRLLRLFFKDVSS